MAAAILGNIGNSRIDCIDRTLNAKRLAVCRYCTVADGINAKDGA